MKIKLIITLCLFVQISFAQAAKPEASPQPKKPPTVDEVYETASKINLAEVEQLTDFTKTIKNNPPASNKIACEFVLGYKKFLRGNDNVFDVLGIYQRLGKTSSVQDAEIIRWASGRASDRVMINKLIGIYSCLPPEEVKLETSNRIIELLKNLGNFAGYMEAGKKLKTLTTASPKEEICGVFSSLKKESDKIEPDLEEFATLYVANDKANPAARTVEFADPRITELAEKILNFRAKLFLPEKEDIKTNLAKYGCQ